MKKTILAAFAAFILSGCMPTQYKDVEIADEYCASRGGLAEFDTKFGVGRIQTIRCVDNTTWEEYSHALDVLGITK